MTPRVDIFAEARRVHAAEVAAAHGAKLSARGRYMRGQCPLCEAGKSSESFQAEAKGPLWHCHACGQGGDAVKLELALGGHDDRVAAARVLAGVAPRVSAEREQRERLKPAAEAGRFGDLVESVEVARHIRRTCQPARGEIVEAWLRARGLDPDGVPGAVDRIRFHPRCPVLPWRRGQDPERGRTAAAMVLLLDRIDLTGRSKRGERIRTPAGVHVTYLRPDGRAKLRMVRRDGSEMPARKMWGETRGAAFWLTEVDAPAGSPLPLVVGEGLETVWAFAERAGRPVRAAAVLSLHNLQGRALRDEKGALPIWSPRADSAGPPMLVDDAGDVIILVDADMKPVKALVQHRRGGPRETVMLNALARAQLCAAIATQHWRSAGARRVSAVRPPAGLDFGDVARGVAA